MFYALYGRPAPDAWLSADLLDKLPATARAPLPSAPASDLVQAPGPDRTTWWPASFCSPGSLVFGIKVALASALAGASLSRGLSGLLGLDGQGVDRLFNLNSTFRLEGALLLLAALVLFPWKGVRPWWNRKGRPLKSWLGFLTLGFPVAAMVSGAMLSTILGLFQITTVELHEFDTYTVQKATLNQIFQINKNGVSSLPDVLSHVSPVCQLFQAHLNEIDAHPATELGQIFNGAQAATGYKHGCLTDADFFSVKTPTASALAQRVFLFFCPGMALFIRLLSTA